MTVEVDVVLVREALQWGHRDKGLAALARIEARLEALREGLSDLVEVADEFHLHVESYEGFDADGAYGPLREAVDRNRGALLAPEGAEKP